MKFSEAQKLGMNWRWGTVLQLVNVPLTGFGPPSGSMRAHMRNLLKPAGSLGDGRRQGYARCASQLAPPLTAAITQAGAAVTSANALNYKAALYHVSKKLSGRPRSLVRLAMANREKTVAGALVGRRAGSAIRKLRLNRFLSARSKEP